MLHSAAKYCKFVDKSDQLCDQFVHGLNASDLKHSLSSAENLTLEKTVTTAKLSERIKQELRTSGVAEKSADEVRRSKHKSNVCFKKPSNPTLSKIPHK